ncbi:hypothetical protein FRC00_010357, partial [Tulasnella sp. 408]
MAAEYINRLPTEAWVLIINSLSDMEQEPNRQALALRSVRRTCRLFGELAFPRFWRRIIIDFDGAWRQVCSALEEDERKRSVVRQLVVKLCGRRASTSIGMEDDDPQTKLTVVKLTNLEELEIYGGKTWSAFLDQMFNLPSLKVCKFQWADIPFWGRPSPCFTSRLSSLEIYGCPKWNFGSNPSLMRMITRMPDLRELRILTCHLVGYAGFKNGDLRSNPTQPLETSPIEKLRLRPFRSDDPVYITDILTFINDCPELQELDMITCKPECIANTSPPPVTLGKLEKFYGYAAVATHVCRGAPVSYFYLCIPREESQGILSDVRNALTAGSVPISKITTPYYRWDPNMMRIISERCRDLKELHYYGFIAESESGGGRGNATPGNSIDPQDLVSLLSELPRLETLTLMLFGLFPRVEVQDQVWESASLALIED